MTTLIELHDLWTNVSQQFRDRCEAAICKTAYYILAEAPETENHAARLAWAQRVLVTTSPEAEWNRMKYCILANAQIAADPDAASDADIEWVVGTYCYLYA